jgi:hypothetical protein
MSLLFYLSLSAPFSKVLTQKSERYQHPVNTPKIATEFAEALQEICSENYPNTR